MAFGIDLFGKCFRGVAVVGRVSEMEMIIGLVIGHDFSEEESFVRRGDGGDL